MILIVKSSLAFYIGACLVITSALSGCGQPGALYLPKVPGKPVKSANPANPASVPAAPTSNPGVAPEFEPVPAAPPAQQ